MSSFSRVRASDARAASSVRQIRAVAGAEYADDAFTPPGDDRPTARRVPKTHRITLISLFIHICSRSELFELNPDLC